MRKLLIPVTPAETIRDKTLELHENRIKKNKTGYQGWKLLKARESAGDYLMSLGGEEIVQNEVDDVRIKLKSEDVVEWIFENLPDRIRPTAELDDETKAFLRFSGLFLMPTPYIDVKKDPRAKLSLMDFYKNINDGKDVTLARSINEKTAMNLLKYIEKNISKENDLNGIGKEIKTQIEKALRPDEIYLSREELLLFARQQKEKIAQKIEQEKKQVNSRKREPVLR